MIVNIIFKNGPEWNPKDYSVVVHHLSHGVPQKFLEESIQWLFTNPLTNVTSNKPTDTTSSVNWQTDIYISEDLSDEDAFRVANSIKEKYEQVIIPEFSKIGYDISVEISK